MFRWQVTGGCELNKFDHGDSDIAILGLKMSKRCKKIWVWQMLDFHLWWFSRDCREMKTESSEHVWWQVTPREHLVEIIQYLWTALVLILGLFLHQFIADSQVFGLVRIPWLESMTPCHCHMLWLHIPFGRHRTPMISDPDYVWHCLSAITFVPLVRTAYDSLWLLCYALCVYITEPSENRWYPSQLDFTWLITTRFHLGPTRNPEAPVLTLYPH
jgi:hypothetical protein